MKLPKITKKRLIITIVILIIIAGSYLVYSDKAEDEEVLERQPEEDFVLQELPDLTFEDVPTDRLIEINDVSVNNFFLEKDPEAAKYSAIVSETDNYTIEYQNRFNKFLILITGDPFESYRTAAENDLLETLGIEQEEACQLNVEITAPHFAQPDEAGNIYNLSFCD